MNTHARLAAFFDASREPRASHARSLGVHESTLCHICAGRKRPSLDLAIRIERLTLGAIRCVDWAREELAAAG